MRSIVVAIAFSAVALPVSATAHALEGLPSKFELFCTSCDESSRFYTTLGFEIVERKDYGYMTLRSGDTIVALSPVPSWLPLRWLWFLRYPPLGTEIVFYTDRLEQLRDALAAAGFKPGEIARQPWGDLDFRVHDYDGYYVRISEGSPIPKRDE